MEKMITFIIPAYNSEKFLKKCLDSFLAGEGVQEKIEVLIVSDGSKDRTCEIGADYEMKYPGIFRLIAKENGGHGSVINVGAANATGKYLKVIDADDWVDTAVLPEYIEGLEKCESDVVLTHYRTLDISTLEEVEWKVKKDDFARIYTLADVHENWADMGDCLTFHGITYKTDFYHKKGTKLAEKVFYEDHQFATIPACFAESISVIDTVLYIYRIGDVNQSVSDVNQYKRRGHMQTVIDAMAEFYMEHKNNMSEDSRYDYTEKLGRLMLAYDTALFMTAPYFSEGRKEASANMDKWTSMIPDICASILKRYRIMKFLNVFHVTKGTFQKILNMRKGAKKDK